MTIPSYIFARGFEWLVNHLNGWQFGEAGAIAALAAKLGGELKDKTFCEFGTGDPDKHGFTCRQLVEHGWGGVVFDSNEANVAKIKAALEKLSRVSVAHKTLAPIGIDSVDRFFFPFGFIPDVLVIDVDGDEHEFWKALEMRPPLVCVEHHDLCDSRRSEFPPIPYNCGQRCAHNDTFVWQASCDEIERIAKDKGYTRAIRTRINSIFVLAENAPQFQKPMRLDIGCGPLCREGFIPIDCKTGIDAGQLPFEENAAEEIYASHVLEHFSKAGSQAALKDWTRVLKSGGIIRIAVPDIDYAFAHREHHHFEGWIMGGQIDEDDFHFSLFWKEKLAALMASCGLVDIQPWVSDAKDCAALPVSLNLQGRKP